MLLNEQMIGEEHAAQAKEMEARFNNKQNEEKIAHLNEITVKQDELAAKQEQIIVAVSIGLGIVILLSLFLFRSNAQRKSINLKLADQNTIIAEKNKDITDSINYARRIQRSVLPDESVLFDNVAEAFLYYEPRDIVSGDFYWFRKEGDRLYIAAADCTLSCGCP